MVRVQRRWFRIPSRKRLAWVLSLIGAVMAWVWAQKPFPLNQDQAAALTCNLEFVVDGDTLELVCAGRRQRVRLHCIDAPEWEQSPWGRASRDHLRSITPRKVIVIPKPAKDGYRDRFGRIVGEVLASGDSRRNLNLSQVASGHAAVYPRFCSDNRYYETEQAARSAKSGIWARSGTHQTPWKTRY